MAVALHGTASTNIDASTSATTVPFLAPSIISTADVWICSAVFRGGSGATISGVPAGFTLINRTDSGAASTNVVIVSYWYIPVGTETASTQFATITLSGASKHTTGVLPLSGASQSAPIVGPVQAAVGTTTATTAALAALATGQKAVAYAAEQGSTTLGGAGSQFGGQTDIASNTTTGGAAATNVGANQAYEAAATQAASQTWSTTDATASTVAIHAFIVDVPGVTILAPNKVVAGMTQAVSRSSVW